MGTAQTLKDRFGTRKEGCCGYSSQRKWDQLRLCFSDGKGLDVMEVQALML
jgi:hypothetical protein